MKSKYLFTFLIIAGIVISGLSSCRFHCVKGSGNMAADSQKVADFSKLYVEGGFKVVLKQDSSSTLKITADDNILKYIKVSANGNTLHIYAKKNFCTAEPITLNIGIHKLEEIKATGGVEIISVGKVTTQDFAFKLSGATKVNMELNAANVTTHGSGSTEINIKGQATTNEVDLSGSGKLYALDFVVGSYNIQTVGASDCEINVLNSLNVHSTGASAVRYKGNPASVNNDKTGASSVVKIN